MKLLPRCNSFGTQLIWERLPTPLFGFDLFFEMIQILECPIPIHFTDGGTKPCFHALGKRFEHWVTRFVLFVAFLDLRLGFLVKLLVALFKIPLERDHLWVDEKRMGWIDHLQSAKWEQPFQMNNSQGSKPKISTLEVYCQETETNH